MFFLGKAQESKLGLIMAAIFIATFMTSVETTIVTTAFPTIISSLHGLSMQSWVFATYLLTTALSTPIYGKLADRIGRKPIFTTGLILFTVGSFFCGISTNIYLLIISRAIQGIGAGAVMPITFTIIADLFTYEKRSNMLAINNTAWGISALLGPIIGGFIVDQLSWHWVFFINVPLGLIVLAIVAVSYKEQRITNTSSKLDVKGIITLSILLVSVLLLFQALGTANVNLLFVGVTVAIAIISGYLVISVEKKSNDPILPINLFKNQLFSIQILTALLLSGIQIGFQTYFPMWLQSIYKAPASIAGLAVTPSPVLWLIASFFVGALVKRFSPKQIALPLIIIQMLTYIPLVFSKETFPQMAFYFIAGLTGIVLGIVITMNTLVSQRVVANDSLGTASSMLTLGRTLGQTIATGIFGLVFNIAINWKLSSNSNVKLSQINNYISANNPAAYKGLSAKLLNNIVLTGMHAVFWVVLCIFITVILVNFTDRNKQIVN